MEKSITAKHQGNLERLPLSQEGDPKGVSQWQGLCLDPGPGHRLSIFTSDLGKDLNSILIKVANKVDRNRDHAWNAVYQNRTRHRVGVKRCWFQILPLPTYQGVILGKSLMSLSFITFKMGMLIIITFTLL